MMFLTILSQTKEAILMQRSLKTEWQIWGSLALHHQETAIGEWHFEGSVDLSAQGQHLVGWAAVLQRAVYSLNQWLIHGTVFPTARSLGTKEVWLDLHTISLSGPLAEFMFSLSAKLVSAKLEILVPNTSASRNRKVFCLIGSYYCCLATTSGPAGKERNYCFHWVNK